MVFDLETLSTEQVKGLAFLALPHSRVQMPLTPWSTFQD